MCNDWGRCTTWWYLIIIAPFGNVWPLEKLAFTRGQSVCRSTRSPQFFQSLIIIFYTCICAIVWVNWPLIMLAPFMTRTTTECRNQFTTFSPAGWLGKCWAVVIHWRMEAAQQEENCRNFQVISCGFLQGWATDEQLENNHNDDDDSLRCVLWMSVRYVCV